MTVRARISLEHFEDLELLERLQGDPDWHGENGWGADEHGAVSFEDAEASDGSVDVRAQTTYDLLVFLRWLRTYHEVVIVRTTPLDPETHRMSLETAFEAMLDWAEQLANESPRGVGQFIASEIRRRLEQAIIDVEL